MNAEVERPSSIRRIRSSTAPARASSIPTPSRARFSIRASEAQSLLRAFNESFLLLAAAFVAASGLILLMRKPTAAAAIDTKGAH